MVVIVARVCSNEDEVSVSGGWWREGRKEWSKEHILLKLSGGGDGGGDGGGAGRFS